MITAAQLHLFTPNAWQGYGDALIQGTTELTAAGITTPLRTAHFLAQCAHETGGLTILRESTGWSGERMKALWPARFPLGKTDPRIALARRDDDAPRKLANLAYSSRSELGNQGGDDGWSYRGGGLLQLTGRSAFRECGYAINIDLESYPEHIEDPAIALRAALWFWGKHDLNRFADHNYGVTISNAINRGNPYSKHLPIGHDDRVRWFRHAWQVFGEGKPVSDPPDLYLGARGQRVLRVQQQLKALGYQVGAEDGVFGPAMARAVAGFKLDARRADPSMGLEPDERVGPATLAAIDTAQPISLSRERAEATAADLVEIGSTTVATGKKAMVAGQAALYTGAAIASEKTGLLDTLTQAMSGISGLHITLVPALAALQWGIRHLLWIALIVGGVWGWVAFRDVILARVRSHQTGENLSK